MVSVSSRQELRLSSRSPSDNSENLAQCAAGCLSVTGLDMTAVRKRAQKPNFSYRWICPGLWAKGEETCTLGTPIGKTLYDGLHQACSDTPIPKVGAYGQWSEEPHTAPVGRKVGPDEFVVDICREGSGRIS